MIFNRTYLNCVAVLFLASFSYLCSHQTPDSVMRKRLFGILHAIDIVFIIHMHNRPAAILHLCMPMTIAEETEEWWHSSADWLAAIDKFVLCLCVVVMVNAVNKCVTNSGLCPQKKSIENCFCYLHIHMRACLLICSFHIIWCLIRKQIFNVNKYENKSYWIKRDTLTERENGMEKERTMDFFYIGFVFIFFALCVVSASGKMSPSCHLRFQLAPIHLYVLFL